MAKGCSERFRGFNFGDDLLELSDFSEIEFNCEGD